MQIFMFFSNVLSLVETFTQTKHLSNHQNQKPSRDENKNKIILIKTE